MKSTLKSKPEKINRINKFSAARCSANQVEIAIISAHCECTNQHKRSAARGRVNVEDHKGVALASLLASLYDFFSSLCMYIV